MTHDGVRLRAALRSVALLATAALAMPTLTACSGDEEAGRPAAPQDIAPAARDRIAEGGTLHWAVDAVPETLNVFQADADDATSRIAGAVLPAMFRLDENGRPERNPDYLESAEVIEREPRQVVLYKLNQEAVWSDGRDIGAADFVAQWRALSGRDTAYWTARNAGYDRIQKIERGAGDLEVRVTFDKPYADWRSLFSPLYPKDVMGSPDAFNDDVRRKLAVTAGPFTIRKIDRAAGDVTLARNNRWWGRPAKLDELVLRAVPRGQRPAALAAGRVDLAELDPEQAGTRELRGFDVRKSLEPAYTQLALNGSEGPLADERVRRAVARALNRDELARIVLKPLGLPAAPVGSHLALAGQPVYADNSAALGGQDTDAARALLADAGWVPGGAVDKQEPEQKEKKAAGAEGPEEGEGRTASPDDGTYLVGEDDKPGEAPHEQYPGRAPEPGAPSARPDSDGDQPDSTGDQPGSPGDQDERNQARQHDAWQDPRRGGAPGAYAPKGTAAPGPGGLAKDGKPLSLRFVLPSGPGTESLRAVGTRIVTMLERVGIRTEVTKVSDASYFKDHIASGQFDLALYSWPASAFPATDARPIYAKPVPGADGALSVEQNYSRVGTDRIDQLFEQAIAELDEGESRTLMRKADAHIWASAGSIPLYQRPQLTATRTDLANAGSFGFQTPVYEDMGFLRKGVKSSAGTSKAVGTSG
ncbi:ABC transporter family substrate-binding protein [Streptomyces cavernae]|uniref:ABC transporter family substrate-binding protein n=1 Tax=Streptomyces cavernae TaxID=2259034 RepID=UPI000FEBFD7C|nr:ABC transporter family substrate-binding protein [Streptomyces cavernae]